MSEGASSERLVVLLATFVVAVAPLTLYGWRVLSDLLSGRVEEFPAFVVVALAAAFAGATWILGHLLLDLERRK